MREKKIDGHTVRVDGQLPETYYDLFEHDISEDVDKGMLIGCRLYVAARENYRRDQEYQKLHGLISEVDPDVAGKTVRDFRMECDPVGIGDKVSDLLFSGEAQPAEQAAVQPANPLP